MKNYHKLLEEVLAEGCLRSDRTGTGTISSFGHMLKFDLRKGLPLVTTKYVNYNNIVGELLWFLRGETNTHTLNSGIWDAWADSNGDLGPIYGAQWAKQINTIVEKLKSDPFSRRLVVDSWQVEDLPNEKISPQENVANGKMALAPCHMMFQFYVSPDRVFLDCNVYQRSQDLFLGGPYNYASYATLMHIIGKFVNLSPRYLNYFIGDAHIYKNHIQLVKLQLKRKPYNLPTLCFNPRYIPDDFYRYAQSLELTDFNLVDYNYHSKLKADIAV